MVGAQTGRGVAASQYQLRDRLMVRLTRSQWVVLSLPLVIVGGFLLLAAGWQIHTWGLSWIWGIFTLMFVGWRWLLVRWTRPVSKAMTDAIASAQADLDALATSAEIAPDAGRRQAAAELDRILVAAQNDPPFWEDSLTFWQRCREVIVAVAHIYHPSVKYPLLNIYIPQAYDLIRGTTDDLGAWIQQLSPILNQVTVGQAYQTYELYQTLEPSARKLWKVWKWVRWVLNPVAAAAGSASKPASDRATQELLGNLSQTLREVALRNLCQRAIALYSGQVTRSSVASTAASGDSVSGSSNAPTLVPATTQTLHEILSQAEPTEAIAQAPVSILLVGRTGAGKSSVINTLFQADRARVDLLPSTAEIQQYSWDTGTGTTLLLWDTPGYEQTQQADLRAQALAYVSQADVVVLVNPVLDPALQMDVDFLQAVQAAGSDIPILTLVTQVDRLRPIREWSPPYDWQWGQRPKEVAIRDALTYRIDALGNWCGRVLPLVTQDLTTGRQAWNVEAVSQGLVEIMEPAKQARMARFLCDRTTRITAAATIIQQYAVQMSTTQGLTTLLKRPVLQALSQWLTGSSTLAHVLAEQIPLEQIPTAIGKLQMAYELFALISASSSPVAPPVELEARHPAPATETTAAKFDLFALWPLVLDTTDTPDRNAWAFGHTVLEYWTQGIPAESIRDRFGFYLRQGGGEAGT